MGFEILSNESTVVHHEVYLDVQHHVYFREGQEEQAAVRGQKRTELKACFDLNKDSRMREICVGLNQLNYPNIPSYFTWNSANFCWNPCETFCIPGSNPKKYDFCRRAGSVIVRMHTVSSRERGRCCRKTLLPQMKGVSSHEDLRKVNGVPWSAPRNACAVHGLLVHYAEWRNALRESFASKFNPHTELFAHILIHCELSDPPAL